MQFYEKYVNLCNSVNKSPSAVAEEIGLTPASATGWSQGAKPRKATLLKIAGYFGVPLSAVASDKESPAENDEASLKPLAPHELELLSYIRSRPREDQPAACQDAEAFLRFRAEKK